MHNNNEKNEQKKNVQIEQLPFFTQLGEYFLTYPKKEALENIDCHLELFELYLNTEIADDSTLRRKFLISTIKMKELAAIINSFKPEQIAKESFKLVRNE